MKRQLRLGMVSAIALPALITSGLSMSSTAIAAPAGNGTFDAIVSLSGCSGAVVRFAESSNSDPALIMTNGHCMPPGVGGDPGPGKAIANRPMDTTATVLTGNRADEAGTININRLVYGTTSDTDVAFMQTDLTYAEFERTFNTQARLVRSDRVAAGTEIVIPSGFWKHDFNCTVDKIIPELHEGRWRWKDSMRVSEGCDGYKGMSGSPMVERATGDIIGIFNTGNRLGEECTVDNPCEVYGDGTKNVIKGADYGQQVDLVTQCVNSAGKIDTSLQSCTLPAGSGNGRPTPTPTPTTTPTPTATPTATPTSTPTSTPTPTATPTATPTSTPTSTPTPTATPTNTPAPFPSSWPTVPGVPGLPAFPGFPGFPGMPKLADAQTTPKTESAPTAQQLTAKDEFIGSIKPQVIDGERSTQTDGTVAFLYRNGNVCTGSLIGDKWALSAKHCLLFNSQDDMYAVRIGSLRADKGGYMVPVKKRHTVDDLAVLELAWVSYSDEKPVKLAEQTPKVGDVVTVKGYGSTSVNGSERNVHLNETQMDVFQTDARDHFGGPAIGLTSEKGTSYKGDSGGPAFDANGVQVGATSTGLIEKKQAFYIDIAAHREWIRSVSGI